MLRTGKAYKVFRGKVSAKGDHTNLTISESTKDPVTGEWKTDAWWTVCVPGVYPCERNDNYRYTIEKITSISQREYKGKNYVTVFAEGQMDTGRANPDGFETVKDDGDLPF